MIDHRPFAKLGTADHGWLQARHHFSFAAYHDRERMGWGALRVWNDDAIAAGHGFPSHPHRDMEIVTYVTQGAITHEDSLGNKGRTQAGAVQVMSAGTGVAHAEFNRENETTRLFQIWIVPDTRGGAPTWGARQFPRGEHGRRFVPLASGQTEDGDALPIRADARVLGITLRAGESATYLIAAHRHAYLVPTRGTARVNGLVLAERDGAAVTGETAIEVAAIDDSELILVDAA